MLASEESEAFPTETGWEKEREAFLNHLARNQHMEASAMAVINADWHSAFTDESHSSSDEYTHGELSGKYHTLHVLNQTSRMLSSASHALSDGDEAVVILGALTGAAIGTVLGIAEHHKQSEASQIKPKLGNPPQSTPTQPSTEPRQDAATQQIQQSMEQSM